MTLTGHQAGVYALAYSPDCCLIGSSSDDGTVRIWDTRTGDETKSILRGTDGSVRSVAFASNGQSLAAGTGLG